MLETRFFGLIATVILISGCNGDIGTVSAAAGREGPTPELGGSEPPEGSESPEPLEPMAQEDPVCPAAAAVLSTRNGWASATAAEPAFDTLDFELLVRPEAANMDALVAVANQNVTDFSDAAILVRFAEDGFIDARDGSGYGHDVPIAYEADAWYSILISADVASRTYDVEVARCGETPKALITDAAFRSDAPVSDRLTTWAAWSSQNAALDIATPSWLAAGGCAPATCESLGLQCGDLSDGCGGTLSCGACQSGETCVVGGICVAPEPSPTPEPPPPTPSPPPPDPGSEGDRPWAHNTGPKDLGALVPSGSIDVTTNGALIENLYVTGNIDIDADNVTLRNFRVDCSGSLYGVRVRDGADNVTVQDGEIWNCDSAGVYAKGTNGLFTNLYLHDMESDGFKTDGNGNTVSWSYLTRLGAGEGSHADGNQSVSGTNNIFEYNNFYMPKPDTPGHDNEPATTDPSYLYPGPPWRSNATFIMHTGTSAIIRNNWLTGGNYTIYGNDGTTVRNNIFGRENADHPDSPVCVNCDGSSRLCNGPFDDWSGNVWEDDGSEAGNNTSCD